MPFAAAQPGPGLISFSPLPANRDAVNSGRNERLFLHRRRWRESRRQRKPMCLRRQRACVLFLPQAQHALGEEGHGGGGDNRYWRSAKIFVSLFNTRKKWRKSPGWAPRNFVRSPNLVAQARVASGEPDLAMPQDRAPLVQSPPPAPPAIRRVRGHCRYIPVVQLAPLRSSSCRGRQFSAVASLPWFNPRHPAHAGSASPAAAPAPRSGRSACCARGCAACAAVPARG